jgi:2-amino-4-hydroxy-6-hydroxymethyldihydropteridine diphosphokinase
MGDEPEVAYIGVGSNLGDRRANVERAVELMRGVEGVRVLRRSRWRRTRSVGAPGPHYLNGVVEVETTRPARALLRELLAIEDRLGRRRPWRWAPRTIDLDLLLYGDRVLRSRGLTVPHPRLASRRFVLAPLAELRPGLRVPGLGRTVKRLLAVCNKGDA